ncbi:MAG6450 family protein [Lactiplantibacillus daowaiensis]|uniref:MAG6450 family protein n=1 Tax=Lactiplantibacillus daowaiensis TaxID=2559918 RepID=A0ABW1RWY2_9LACO|nr:hypothetical protein [Lactiplantibacillus daowaiensis]
MGKRLIQPRKTALSPSALTQPHNREQQFKLAIETTLDHNFDFKHLKTQDSRQFNLFITKTVGRELSVTAVKPLFLRTGGPRGAKNIELINGVPCSVMHFSDGTRDFRIHGYYNMQGYLVVVRIDAHHQYKY